MNGSQFHLALTHLPVVLSLTGFVMFFVSLFIKKPEVQRIALYILTAAGLFAIPVFFTGEGAEEAVENLPGVSETLIEKHESLAKISLWIILLTATASIVALVNKGGRSLSTVLRFPVLVLAFVSVAMMAATAHYGGQIRHTEISAASVANARENGSDGDETKMDDDD